MNWYLPRLGRISYYVASVYYALVQTRRRACIAKNRIWRSETSTYVKVDNFHTTQRTRMSLREAFILTSSFINTLGRNVKKVVCFGCGLCLGEVLAGSPVSLVGGRYAFIYDLRPPTHPPMFLPCIMRTNYMSKLSTINQKIFQLNWEN